MKDIYTPLVMFSFAYLAISGLLLASYGNDSGRAAILMVAVIVWLMSFYPLVLMIKEIFFRGYHRGNKK